VSVNDPGNLEFDRIWLKLVFRSLVGFKLNLLSNNYFLGYFVRDYEGKKSDFDT